MIRTTLCRVLACGLVAIFASIAPPALANTAQKLPHYFPEGFITATTPLDQWALYLEFLKATSSCMTPNASAPPSTYLRTIKEVVEVHGKKVTFHFNPWTREADGKIYYTDYCARKRVSEEDFALVRSDLIAYYRDGVRGAYEYHRNLESDILKSIAASQKKSVEEIRASLAMPVPELSHVSPPVNFRELQQIPPSFSERDFVQTEVHFTHMAPLGAVYLNTETVFLSLQGRIADHLIGKPNVAVHELTHGNEKLQDLIFSRAIDLEMLASLPEMLIPEDHIATMLHGYMKEGREMIEVLFGFNFAQARKEIIEFDYIDSTVRINGAKLNEYVGKLDAIKVVLNTHYRDVVLPELYKNRIFWASLHNKMGDKHAVFRIMAMKDFDPTIVDGHAKTTEFLSANEEVIRSMAEKAFAKSGIADKQSPGGSIGGGHYDASTLRFLTKMLGMTEDDLKRLAQKHNIELRRLANVSTGEALSVILPILRAERIARPTFPKENLK